MKTQRCPRTEHPELGAYLDGQLSPAARTRLAQHLDGCAACRQELTTLRGVRQALRQLPARELSDDFEARVMAEALRRKPEPTVLAWWNRARWRMGRHAVAGGWAGGGLTVAAAAMAILLSVKPPSPGTFTPGPDHSEVLATVVTTHNQLRLASRDLGAELSSDAQDAAVQLGTGGFTTE